VHAVSKFSYEGVKITCEYKTFTETWKRMRLYSLQELL